MAKAVRIFVDSKDVMIDQKFDIRVTGLPVYQDITIHASIQEGRDLFASVGNYRASSQGIVACSEQASLSGSYTGIHDLGLIWSMTQAPGQKPGRRLIKKNVCTPQIVTFQVFIGHLSLEDIYLGTDHTPIAVTEVKRWYKAQNVKRVPVRQGNIKGTLFIPPGSGPFPCVLELFGSAGGLLEFKAALLASHGFMTLALAYFNFEGLSSNVYEMDMHYFKEAVAFLANHPLCIDHKIGVMGVSLGGMYAQLLALRYPQVKAVVSVSGPPYVIVTLFEGDKVIKQAVEPVSLPEATEEGYAVKCVYRLNAENLIPVWDADVRMLSVCGTDDQNVPLELYWLQRDKCPKDKNRNFQLLCYEGAGHLIEPPYSPLSRASYQSLYGMMTLWGGNTVDHAFAQEDSWRRIIEFFNQTLNIDSRLGKTLHNSKL